MAFLTLHCFQNCFTDMIALFDGVSTYSGVSHITNSYLMTILKLYPISNLMTQNLFLTAIILGVWDQISNFPPIAEFLPYPGVHPSLPSPFPPSSSLSVLPDWITSSRLGYLLMPSATNFLNPLLATFWATQFNLSAIF